MNELILSPEPSLPLLSPGISPKQMIEFHNYVDLIIKEVLVEGRDYGVIPGTNNRTLWKSGAESFNMALGTRPEFIIIEKEIDHYKEIPWKKDKEYWDKNQKCYVQTSKSGISYGVYRYIYKCLIVRQGYERHVIGEGEGSASSFESKYIDRPRDLENTIVKMAMKRAFLAATLQAFALSNRFALPKVKGGSMEVNKGNGGEEMPGWLR